MLVRVILRTETFVCSLCHLQERLKSRASFGVDLDKGLVVSGRLGLVHFNSSDVSCGNRFESLVECLRTAVGNPEEY